MIYSPEIPVDSVMCRIELSERNGLPRRGFERRAAGSRDTGDCAGEHELPPGRSPRMTDSMHSCAAG
jgi:hypothetical protein